MAASSPTKPHSFLTTLLPLLALALATIAAFLLAIHNNVPTLAALWTTPCAPDPPLARLPTPVCFAVHFFHAAHATPRARLEQAVIVSFLAGLATITAVERARVVHQRDARDTAPASVRWSRAIIAYLAVPWLLYNLALGALAWQGIIIPAFLHCQRQRPLQTGPRNSEARNAAADSESLAIPLSVTLGLLFPASVMLLRPTATVPILLFLLFPLWIALIQHLLRPLTSGLAPNKALLFAPPIIASTLAHLALLVSLLPTKTTWSPTASTTAHVSASAAAIRLLELDHIAIYLAALYWVLLEAGARGLLATLATTIALGPGAGVCAGWLSCPSEKDESLPPLPPSKTDRPRKGGKATGTFFGGLPG